MTGSQPSVRDALPGDVDFIVDANVRMGAETEGKRLDPAVVAAGVRRGLSRQDLCRYFVAEVAGYRAGTVMITYELTDWRDGVIWWLQSVYVAEAYRRRGVFRAMYRHVEALARSNGEVRGLRLYVRTANARARQTYEALGMSASGYEVYTREW